MTAYATSHRRALRHTLRIGTALASGLLASAFASNAVAAPVVVVVPTAPALTALPVIATGNPAVGAAAVTGVQAKGASVSVQIPTAGNMTVTASTSAIINWGSYNIGANASVSYQAALASACTVSCTVLNRDISGNASQLFGAISAPATMNIWVFNGSGIAVGSGGTFSGGSLVLSTLDTLDASKIDSTTGQFVAGYTTPVLDPTQAAPSNIELNAGLGTIELVGTSGTTTLGASGNVLLVSNLVKIDSTASIVASGSVGIVGASDVTFAAGPGSPLSFTVNKGSLVTAAQGPAVTISGSVTGSSVTADALSATNPATLATLLQIGGGGTLVATGIGGVVTIADGTSGTSAGANANDRISLGGTVATTSGTNGAIAVYGATTLAALTTLDSSAGNGNITIGGTVGNATGLGPFGLTLAAGTGTISLGGQVGTTASALGTVSLTGGNIGVSGIDAAGLTTTLPPVLGTLTLNGGDYTIATPTPYVFGAATTNGTLTLGQATTFGTLTLGSDTTINTDLAAGSVALTFGSVSGAKSLAVNAGTGSVTLNGLVGTLLTPLTSLTLTGSALALDGGSVFTGGSQDYQGAVTLGSNSSLTTTSGPVTFGSKIDGPFSLTVQAGTSAIVFDAQAGGIAPLGTVSLTGGPITLAGVDAAGLGLTNSGALTLNGGDYTIAAPTPYVFGIATTNGTLTLGQATTFGALTLGSDTTINTDLAAGSAALIFGSVSGGKSLAVNAGTGSVTVNGTVGTSATPLTSLTLTGSALALDGGSVFTSGSQDYQGAVTLGSTSTTLTAGSTVTFENTLDGNVGLTVAGNAVFGNLVGSTPLASLTVTGNSLIDTTAITTTGLQDYQGAVTLGATTVFHTTNSNITIGGTVGNATGLGPFDLTLTAGTGAISLDGQVGTTTSALGTVSLTGGNIGVSGVDAAGLGLNNTGALTLNGGDYTIATPTPYVFGIATTNGTLTLGQATTFHALTLGSDTTINSDFAAGSAALVYTGTISGSHLFATTAGGDVTFNGTVNVGNGFTAKGADVVLNAAIGGLAGLGVTLTATTGDVSQNIGVITAASLGATANLGNVLLTDSNLASSVTGSSKTNFDYTSDATFSVGASGISSQNVTLSQNSGDITSVGGISATNLSVTATSGSVTLNQSNNAVSSISGSATGNFVFTNNTTPLTVNAVSSSAGAVSISGGSTLLANGAISAADDVTLTAPGGITLAVAPQAGAGKTLTLDTSGGNAAVDFTTPFIGNGENLTVTAGSGTITLKTGATVGDVDNLSLSGGLIALNSGGITTSGSQSYDGLVTIGAATNLITANSSVTFTKAVSGNYALSVGAGSGAVTLAGVDVAQLVLSNSNTGTLTLNTGTYTIASPAPYVFGAATTNGTLTLGQATTFGALTLGSSTALDSGNFAIGLGTIDGGVGHFALTVATGSGGATFGGIVGGVSALGSLTVSGPSQINTTAIKTTGLQDYQGAVTLTSASTLSTTNSPVTFASTLDGPYALTVNAGTGLTLFDNLVGNTSPLASLTVSGPSQINTGSIITTGLQDYQGAVTLTSASTLAAATGSIVFGTTIDGAQSLTLAAPASTVTFGGVVGGITPLTALTATATNATINAAINSGNITLIDSGPAGSTLQLGDAVTGMPTATGFVLTGAEVGYLQATGSLVIDGSQFNKPNIVTGNFTIAAPVTSFGLYGLGTIDVYGNIIGTGTRLASLQIGGDTSTSTDTASIAADIATQLIIFAKPAGGLGADGTPTTGTSAGGAINAGTAALSLNAAAIAVGQDQGFLNQLGAGPGRTLAPSQAQAIINNPGSSLYDAVVGGGSTYTTPDTIYAGTLTVRYTNFALFQNTAIPGTNTGITLGSAARPASPALTIYGGGTSNNDPFAVFGVINGVRDVQTALLGSATINAQNISPPISRINGCVIGSSAACLTPAPLSTVLQVVDAEHVTIFYANADYIVAFDPLVGTNNEALFDDFSSLGLGDVRDPTPDCLPGGKTACPDKGKGAHP